ncbi:MAG: DUF58 domain-containing protein [Magnetococcales bacterium]|nr:DUF58 domain-containing protein [Magnetococcales bacterium]
MNDALTPACCPAPVFLGRHRLRIVFNRDDWFAVSVLFVILVVAFQTGLNLALGLVSLLIGTFLVAILHAWRNISGLQVAPLPSAAVFAGEVACFRLGMESTAKHERWAIRVRARTETAKEVFPLPEGVDWSGTTQVVQEIHVPAHRRGWLRLTETWIETDYPLGLARVRAKLSGEWRCLIYPQPDQELLPLPLAKGDGDMTISQRGGGEDDLANLRDYQPGDPLQKIHWKTSARRDRLVVREFFSMGQQVVWLAWEGLTGMAEEARLSRLCRWVLDADRAGVPFGLSLPNEVIAPSRGEAHRTQCLTALALFGRK